jgi:hypothetical protein
MGMLSISLAPNRFSVRGKFPNCRPADKTVLVGSTDIPVYVAAVENAGLHTLREAGRARWRIMNFLKPAHP